MLIMTTGLLPDACPPALRTQWIRSSVMDAASGVVSRGAGQRGMRYWRGR